jgi:hypothetical protein
MSSDDSYKRRGGDRPGNVPEEKPIFRCEMQESAHTDGRLSKNRAPRQEKCFCITEEYFCTAEKYFCAMEKYFCATEKYYCATGKYYWATE